MIRNVVVGRVRPDVPTGQVEAALQALRDLVDADAYRVRRELFAHISASIERVQFQLSA